MDAEREREREAVVCLKNFTLSDVFEVCVRN